MDFIEVLQTLSSKIQKQKDFIQTEEATKNAFIMPFINALGYDIFDPTEVVPEFTADVGIKKGEKVDYAIKLDGKVIMLIECKPCNTSQLDSYASQLFRYFSVTEARIAILTDGITYLFYSDIEEENKMDSKPFMEFNMLSIQEHLVPDLKRLTKQAFNLNEILTVAGEMKYTREIKRLISEQLTSPSDELVKVFAGQVYSGNLVQSVREQFTNITKRAFLEFINDTINDRLRSAMSGPPLQSQAPPSQPPSEAPSVDSTVKDVRGVITDDELQAYYIVKAILRETTDPTRIVYRAKLTRFSILLDDNNKKTICRLYFDKKQKQIGIFDAAKQEEKFPIDDLNGIFKYANLLKASIARCETKQSSHDLPQESPPA